MGFEEEKNEGRMWPFRIQFITLVLLLLIIITINIPTGIVKQFAFLQKLFDLGMVGVGAVFLFAFPIGMIGFLNARDEKVRPRFNSATKVLGVINCVVGAMFVGIVLMILFFSLVKGV